ncbi:hypothetical protein HQ865_10620 [Mucilaginibacter mali]|uniref:Uncharacterized protein n=1 Tax=Mucilaginibacter mali TaxID=2740462 RepID=A0A7D4UFB7_9SPHI|nr:hypothetical protein [Mucilaginibacter mali]QKJ30196.1 hypothetical protein HQ865_10620 [Mucilaginibacter mali]
MVTEESLKERYANLDTAELLIIIADKGSFTPLAVSIAQLEIEKRGVSGDVIEQFEEEFEKLNRLHPEDYLADLKVWHKVVFFIVWIPNFSSSIRRAVIGDGDILRAQQANYYMVTGFFSLFIAAGADSYLPGTWFPALWATAFLLVYLFDRGYNRKRQEHDIQKRVDKKGPSSNFF